MTTVEKDGGEENELYQALSFLEERGIRVYDDVYVKLHDCEATYLGLDWEDRAGVFAVVRLRTDNPWRVRAVHYSQLETACSPGEARCGAEGP